MIIPLIKPDIDLQAFIDLANRGVGNVTKAADESRRPLTIYEKFISGLFSLKRSGNIKESLNNAGTLISHISFTFAAVHFPEVIAESMEKSSLVHTVVDAKKKLQIAIISGTLLQFKLAILECTTLECSDEIRQMYFEIFLVLEELGFREVLHFRKVSQRDGTFLLESK